MQAKYIIYLFFLLYKKYGTNDYQKFAEVRQIVCSDGDFNLGTHYSDDLRVLFKWNECIAHCVVPDGVTTIADRAFAGTEIESIIIPNSVTHIGKEAFDVPLIHPYEVDYYT